MKRSGPIQRRTPLKSSKPLERKAALSVSPTARSRTHANSAAQRHQPKRASSSSGVPARVRKALAERSGGLCEVAQPGCARVATDFSHRLRTGMGGRHGAAARAHHVLSNALAACRPCHAARLHAQPKEAYAAGWILREGQIPTAERVLYRGVWVFLTDDGSVLTTNPIAA